MEDKSSSGATAAVESGEANTSPAKKSVKSKAAKVQRPRSTHPSTSEMVNSAIKELKDRKGSSLQAIKKYIANTYKVDSERFAPFIKKYLKTAVTSGTVVQTKGKGASGSFKLSTNKTTTETKAKPQRPVRGAEAAEAKPVKKKTATAQKATKKASPAKRSAAVEKKPVAQKKTAAKTTTAEKAKAVKTKAAQPKAISKTKKTAKAPAAKTKTPKPKKAAASKTVKSSPRK